MVKTRISQKRIGKNKQNVSMGMNNQNINIGKNNWKIKTCQKTKNG